MNRGEDEPMSTSDEESSQPMIYGGGDPSVPNSWLAPRARSKSNEEKLKVKPNLKRKGDEIGKDEKQKITKLDTPGPSGLQSVDNTEKDRDEGGAAFNPKPQIPNLDTPGPSGLQSVVDPTEFGLLPERFSAANDVRHCSFTRRPESACPCPYKCAGAGARALNQKRSPVENIHQVDPFSMHSTSDSTRNCPCPSCKKGRK